MSKYRVVLVVPSEIDLPTDLYRGDIDYHEGWLFEGEMDAIKFATQAKQDHPGVVVDYDIYGGSEHHQ